MENNIATTKRDAGKKRKLSSLHAIYEKQREEITRVVVPVKASNSCMKYFISDAHISSYDPKILPDDPRTTNLMEPYVPTHVLSPKLVLEYYDLISEDTAVKLVKFAENHMNEFIAVTSILWISTWPFCFYFDLLTYRELIQFIVTAPMCTLYYCILNSEIVHHLLYKFEVYFLIGNYFLFRIGRGILLEYSGIEFLGSCLVFINFTSIFGFGDALPSSLRRKVVIYGYVFCSLVFMFYALDYQLNLVTTFDDKTISWGSYQFSVASIYSANITNCFLFCVKNLGNALMHPYRYSIFQIPMVVHDLKRHEVEIATNEKKLVHETIEVQDVP